MIQLQNQFLCLPFLDFGDTEEIQIGFGVGEISDQSKISILKERERTELFDWFTLQLVRMTQSCNSRTVTLVRVFASEILGHEVE